MKGFNPKHFDTFKIDDFEERLKVIKYVLVPKLKVICKFVQPMLSSELNEEFYIHVPRINTRRKKPPEDTWVAISTSERVYKRLPHFRIGMNKDFIYTQFGVLSEYPKKVQLADTLSEEWNVVKNKIPYNYLWTFREGFNFEIHANLLYNNHLLRNALKDLRTVNLSELVCGTFFDRYGDEVVDNYELLIKVSHALRHLYPLYDLSKKVPSS